MKKLIAAVAIVCLLSACSMLPSKKISTQIDINATQDIVWRILMDNSAYPLWNPYHVKAEGKLAVGEKLKLEIHKPNGNVIKIKPRVMAVEPKRLLVWGGE